MVLLSPPLPIPPHPTPPLNIQPVVVVRGLKRQQVAALTNFVGCFFSCSVLLLFFSPSALDGLAGPSAGPLAPKNIFLFLLSPILWWCLPWDSAALQKQVLLLHCYLPLTCPAQLHALLPLWV